MRINYITRTFKIYSAEVMCVDCQTGDVKMVNAVSFSKITQGCLPRINASFKEVPDMKNYKAVDIKRVYENEQLYAMDIAQFREEAIAFDSREDLLYYQTRHKGEKGRDRQYTFELGPLLEFNSAVECTPEGGEN